MPTTRREMFTALGAIAAGQALLADAFARVATTDDVDSLIDIASNPINGSARPGAAEALGRFKKHRDKSVPVLMVLRNDKSDCVYSSAAHALGLLREQSAKGEI